MSREAHEFSAGNISLGWLEGYLVDGDKDQRSRERKIRRRSLAVSIALESAILAALVLIPLFGKPERIALAHVMPLPPYRAHHEPREAASPATPEHSHSNARTFSLPTGIPPVIAMHVASSPDSATTDTPGMDAGPIGAEVMGATNIVPTVGPKPPETHSEVRQPIKITHLDPAMLIHRVEPVYPTLAKQMGRGGRVELRAIIATDGSIQSLQVVGGDPLFFSSALAAVEQWRYRATVLNGQPVEIDTFVTVIYNLER
jgi:periplasmic protein TonB